MDLASLIGLILSIIVILTGMVLKGATLSILWNPAAILIIIFGTVSAVVIAFPGKTLATFPKLLKVIFFDKKKEISDTELIRLFVEWAQLSRKEGLLSLEDKLPSVQDEFLQNTLKNVIDGLDSEKIQEIAEAEIEAVRERHSKGIAMFTQAGTYAPTLGVLGAVVGLIAALGHLDDTDSLGHAVASAFVATLLGIYTGYVLWHPFANKLKQKSEEEIERMYLILDACLMLQSGIIPSLLEKRMLASISPKERKKYDEAKKGGAQT